MNLIVIADRRDDHLLLNDEVGEAKTAIQAVIKAYHDNTSMAYQTGGITDLANSLGDVGCAYILNTEGRPFEEMSQGLGQNRLKLYIGPGNLNPYNQMAMTLRKNGEDTLVTFILAYSDQITAEKNVEVIEERLKAGLSLMRDKPLTDYWTVQEVIAAGSYLQATVKINEPQPGDGTGYSFVVSVWMGDYWFLYPGSADFLDR